MFADMRAEEAKMGEDKMTHMFVGIAGFDGTGKSGVVKDAFDKACEKDPTLELHALDFDMGVAMLNSAVNKNPNIKSWKPWQMGVNDHLAYDYPGTHDRVMKIMRYILHQVESGEANVWGVLVSGLDSWLEICTNNMRIIDLGLAKDGIESADIRGAGEAKRVERQSDWAIRNTRFHQLTALSVASCVRVSVSLGDSPSCYELLLRQGERQDDARPGVGEENQQLPSHHHLDGARGTLRRRERIGQDGVRRSSRSARPTRNSKTKHALCL